MRNVLVDYARVRGAAKRGGGAEAAELREDLWTSEIDFDAVQDLDEALKKLETVAPRQNAILEQHYFGGLAQEEIAGALGISVRTVKRELRAARAWLAVHMAPTA